MSMWNLRLLLSPREQKTREKEKEIERPNWVSSAFNWWCNQRIFYRQMILKVESRNKTRKFSNFQDKFTKIWSDLDKSQPSGWKKTSRFYLWEQRRLLLKSDISGKFLENSMEKSLRSQRSCHFATTITTIIINLVWCELIELFWKGWTEKKREWRFDKVKMHMIRLARARVVYVWVNTKIC